MGSPGTSPTSPAPSSPRPFMRQLSPCAVPQSGKEVVCTVDVGSKPITWLCGYALAHTVETAEVQVDELHVCTALIGSWPRRSPLSSSTPLAPSYALATWSEWPRRRRWYDGRPVCDGSRRKSLTMIWARQLVSHQPVRHAISEMVGWNWSWSVCAVRPRSFRVRARGASKR